MRTYQVEISESAQEDINKFIASGNIIAINKIFKLIDELYEHPKIGTGKPEFLKHKKYWSRRINKEHRLCYEIEDDKVIVLVLSAYGHYED